MAYDLPNGRIAADRSRASGSVPDEAAILAAAEHLAAAGVSVHWLKRREKAPVGTDGNGAGWQTADTQSAAQLRAS